MRRLSALALTVATYALLVAAGSALHHDFICSFKSRAQCTTCEIGMSSPGLTSERQTITPDPCCGSELTVGPPQFESAGRRGRSPGRAPPA